MEKYKKLDNADITYIKEIVKQMPLNKGDRENIKTISK